MEKSDAPNLLREDEEPWSERATMLAAIVAYAGLSGFGGWLLPHLTQSPLLAGLATHPASLDLGQDLGLVAGAATLMTLPATLAVECLAVGWKASSLRQMLAGATASIKTDIAFVALSHVQFTDIAGKLTMLAASMVTGLWLRQRIASALGFEIDPGVLPLAAQVGIYFFVYTFFDYASHRLYHWRLFWPLHRYHHAATDFSVLNAVRAHPVAPVGMFLVNLPMAVLGASPLVMIWVNALAQGQSFLIHSRIDSSWGWFGRWVLQSPNHHRLHHKLDMSHPTGHFSLAPIWDHLFGTWYGDADQTLVIGVDTPYRHGLWIAPDVLRDFQEFCRGFRPQGARHGPPSTARPQAGRGLPV